MSAQTPIENPPVGAPPPPPPPKRRHLKWWHWALIALGVFVVLGILIEAVSGGGNTTTQSTTQQQPTQAPAATQAPTTAPQPTVVPQPTATPLPTATPQPLTPQQQLDKTIQDTTTLGKVTEATWDGADGMVLISLDAADAFTESGVADKIKMDAYSLLRSVYTSGPVPKLWVQVTFNADTTDIYGNTSHGRVASASLAPATAAKFNWSNLTWRTAWPAYDRTYMLPDLANG